MKLIVYLYHKNRLNLLLREKIEKDNKSDQEKKLLKERPYKLDNWEILQI